MSNSSRDAGSSDRGGGRADRLAGALGLGCVALCVIAGLAVVGWLVFVGIAMSRYGSNK